MVKGTKPYVGHGHGVLLPDKPRAAALYSLSEAFDLDRNTWLMAWVCVSIADLGSRLFFSWRPC